MEKRENKMIEDLDNYLFPKYLDKYTAANTYFVLLVIIKKNMNNKIIVKFNNLYFAHEHR